MYCIWRGTIKEKFAFFSFNFAYIVLLLGTFICSAWRDNFWGKHIFAAIISYISMENEALGLFYIQLAQSTTFITYLLLIKQQPLCQVPIANVTRFINIRLISKIIMIIGGIAAFTKVCTRVLFVMQNGYVATYLATGDALFQNPLIDLFDRFYYVGLFGYLATYPKVKCIVAPLILFGIYSFLSLLTGVRGELVVNVFFITWYCMKRDIFLYKAKTIFTKKRMVALSFIVTFLIIPFFFDYGYSRTGWKVKNIGHIDKIIGFFNAQGYSGRLVALGLQNQEEIFEYTSAPMIICAPIRNFIVNNSLIRMFTGVMLGQNSANISSVGLFGNVITFVTKPSVYFNGGGLGTSFVSELAVSYGAVGIIIFCILLGKLLCYLDQIDIQRWELNVWLMDAFRVIVFLPRGSTTDIIPLSFVPLLFIVFVSISVSLLEVRITPPLNRD